MDILSRFPSYIREAVIIVSKLERMEDLVICPPIVKVLPTSSSGVYISHLQIIASDILLCLQMDGLSDEERGWLILLVNLLPRFISTAPVRELGKKGKPMSKFRSVQERTRKFMENGGPSALWHDHLMVSRFLERTDEKEAGGANEEGSDLLSSRELEKVEASLACGELHEASKIMSSEFGMLHMDTAEEIEGFFYSKYERNAVENPQLAAIVKEALDKAEDEGLILSPKSRDFEQLLSAEEIMTTTRGPAYARQKSADAGGWRPFHLRCWAKIGGHCLDLIVEVANLIACANVPENARWYTTSQFFWVLQHKQAKDKRRLINPSVSALVTLSTSTFMKGRSSITAENVAPVQMGVGIRDGAGVAGHLHALLDSTAAAMATKKEDKVVNLVADIGGFYYGVSKTAWVGALIEAKDYAMLRIAWSLLTSSEGKVCSRTRGGEAVFLDIPVNGLPVGNPLAAYLATLPVTLAYKQSIKECTQGDPAAVNRFSKNLSVAIYMDDMDATGNLTYMVNFLRVFTLRLREQGIATFAPGKGGITVLNGAMTVADKNRICVALFDDAQTQRRHFELTGHDTRAGSRRDGNGSYAAAARGGGRLKCDEIEDMRLAVNDGKKAVKFLGGLHGDCAALEGAATEICAKVDKHVSRVQQLAFMNQLTVLQYTFVHKYTFLMGQQGAGSEFASVWKHLDKATSGIVQNICGIRPEEVKVQAPRMPRWSAVQDQLLQIPSSMHGGGLPSAESMAPYAFLAKFLSMAEFVKEPSGSANSLRYRALTEVWTNRESSEYAQQVHEALEMFLDLFARVEGRPPTMEADGFDGKTLESLPPPIKFQRLANKLVGKERYVKLVDSMTEGEKRLLSARNNQGHVGWYTSLGFPISDACVSVLLQIRLNVNGLGGFEEGDRCPGVGCNLKGELSAEHVVGCVHVGPKGANSYLHEALRHVVKELLQASGVGFDPQDLTKHPVVLQRLKDAGYVRKPGSGLHKGGDILATDIMGQPGQLGRNLEMVLDVTVTSKFGTTLDPLSELTRLEKDKTALYEKMYKLIDCDVYGLAVDAWGNLGPNVLRLIEQCEKHVGLGWEGSVPSWATWKCPTFKQAWMYKFIVTMQVAGASKLAYAASRVRSSRARRAQE